MADLTAFQVERGWRVAVASPPEGDLARWTTAAGARHLAWRASRSPGPSVPREVRALRRLIGGVAPDLVHLHSAKAGLAGRLALRGRRATIYQPHAWSFRAATGPLRGAARAWERISSRWADSIVCVSEQERVEGIEAGLSARWEVIPNGVDLARFGHDRDDARRELALDVPLLVVCVGRLSRQKGQDVLLRAWPLVSAACPGARLALVGTGPDERALRAGAPRDVLFVGATDAVPRWLAAADVVALPSRWEGMSLAMLEAMAAARSIVMSDVAGAHEALGDAAGVVPPEDPDALAEALLRRLRDERLRTREGRAARRRAEDMFGLERPLAALHGLYLEILRRRGE